MQFLPGSYIITDVVTLIALKREVAAGNCGFSVEQMSSYDTWRQVTVQNKIALQ